MNCTYCIIPRVRPVVRSRAPAEIVEEVAGLVAGGVHEIVLTGIHLGHYGLDLSKGKPKLEWRRLWHLLDRLADVPGDFRIRLSSLEAAEARDDLVRAVARHPRVVPHLHLCLQSGSDRILTLMKRRYRARGFLERCARLRAALDTPAFTTDIIVGFPGETDADFQQTLQVARAAGFAKIHVFSYSRRAGTPAAALPNGTPSAVVAERRARLLELERDLAATYARTLIGRRLEALVEGAAPDRPGQVLGTSCRYLPVSFRGHAAALVGRLAPVRVTGNSGSTLLAEPVADDLVPKPFCRPLRFALPMV